MSRPAVSKPVVIAPAPDGLPTPRSLTEDNAPKNNYACLNCSKRKVKCDKTGPPCWTCRGQKVECFYQAPPPRKKRKLTNKHEDSSEIKRRLERYERLLKDHDLLTDGSDADDEESAPVIDATPPKEPDQPRANTEPDPPSVPAKEPYNGSSLIKVLNAVNQDIDVFDESDNNPTQRASTYFMFPPQESMSSIIFGLESAPQNLIDFHPTYENGMKMLDAYFDRVEPIIKMQHSPTVKIETQQAVAHPDVISTSTECLLFAMYHFAVRAMSDTECKELLGEDQSALRAKYNTALRYALINADFLRSKDLEVLQAFILFLLAVRAFFDPQLLWMLTGIAVRMAQRMKLHQDGKLLGLSPFDAEICRRTFYQLPQLDGLAGQLCGTGINMEPGTWSTNEPSNINDKDLRPDMTEAPIERKGATEMILCLSRLEMGKFLGSMKSYLSALADGKNKKLMADAERQIDEVESKIELKFLRYCDPVDPLHVFTSIGTRASILSSRLRLGLFRAKAERVDSTERKEIFGMAVRTLDYLIAIYSNKSLAKFLWHTHMFFIWDSLIWVLSELRHSSVVDEPDAAWSSIEALFTW